MAKKSQLDLAVEALLLKREPVARELEGIDCAIAALREQMRQTPKRKSKVQPIRVESGATGTA